jgi:hypothetical protein
MGFVVDLHVPARVEHQRFPVASSPTRYSPGRDFAVELLEEHVTELPRRAGRQPVKSWITDLDARCSPHPGGYSIFVERDLGAAEVAATARRSADPMVDITPLLRTTMAAFGGRSLRWTKIWGREFGYL